MLDEPLSFWGGFESETGTIIDQAHPQVGASLSGRVMSPSGAVRVRHHQCRRGHPGSTAPAALVLQESDEIIVLGAIVADEIYGIVMPILILDEGSYRDMAAAQTASTNRTARSPSVDQPAARRAAARSSNAVPADLNMVTSSHCSAGMGARHQLGEIGEQTVTRNSPASIVE